MPKARFLPSVRPDLDNLAKAFLDAANELLFQDDSQVVEMHLQKTYGEPGTWYQIYEVLPAQCNPEAKAVQPSPLEAGCS